MSTREEAGQVVEKEGGQVKGWRLIGLSIFLQH